MFENILLNPALTTCSERNAVEDEWVLCLQNKWVQQQMAELCYFVLQQLLTLNESALSCSRIVLFILFTLPILLVHHPTYFIILLNLMFYLLHYYFFCEHLRINTKFHGNPFINFEEPVMSESVGVIWNIHTYNMIKWIVNSAKQMLVNINQYHREK